MADHHFLVGLSMDGPPNYHNLYRKAKNLEGSHSLVMHGLEILKKYQIDTNILTCISQANVKDPIGTYRYFRDELQIEHLQFIPIVERENIVGNQKGSRLSSRSITGKEFGAFLIPLFDEWIHKDVGSIFVQLFESTIGWYLGYRSSICIFSETCGDCLALEHNGDLYSCDHFVEPGFLLGNIKKSNLKSLVTGSSQLSFGHSKKGLLPLKCHQCDVLALCNGDCVKNRILPDRKGDFPISHLCEGYRSFFRHSKVSMQMMASLIREHKLVQNIMQMV